MHDDVFKVDQACALRLPTNTMIFSHMWKALCWRNNSNDTPEPSSKYNPNPPAPAAPTKAAPCTNPAAHDHDQPDESDEGLKPPHDSSSSSAGLQDQPATSPSEPKGDRKKKGKRKGTGGRSDCDTFDVRGNTITGCKGGKIGIFDFGNTYT
ncbi:unnamed protein product [Prunus armeniaca]|uniref:Uncharacterized protein n=1 Tax=Prunus armeniaca TaxID=36596 RepID=A0A6J5THZ6_PRUAR|nr:unnamed protein product [Prunus armeniaca]